MVNAALIAARQSADLLFQNRAYSFESSGAAVGTVQRLQRARARDAEG